MKSEEIEIIKKEFYLQELLHKNCFFDQYKYENNKVFYSIEDENTRHELHIIAKNTDFKKEERIVVLLELPNLHYLRHEIFIKEKEKWVFLDGITHIEEDIQ